jgi:ADP-heptose:LPS heptosyltransferase
VALIVGAPHRPVPAATDLPGHHPGADRGAPVDPRALRRVLVVRADNIGDVVMAVPAVRALRVVAPQARIDLLASPAGARVAPMVPEIDGVVETSPSWQQLTAGETGVGAQVAAEWTLLDELRCGGYDALLVFTSSTQSPWPVAHLGLMAGIALRAVHSAEFGGTVATHWVTPPPEGTHQVDRCLHLLAAIGLAPTDPGRTPALDVPPAAQDEADAALAGSGLRSGEPFVALAPGASCASRRYPAERFAVAAAAIAAAGLPVRVTGAETEIGLVAAVAETAGHRDVRVLQPTSVPGFAGVLRRAAVAVTNNSGGMHLADAVGTPLVVTWAGTEPHAAMAPRSVPAALLGRRVPCSPCRLLTCPYDHGCLDVTPARVVAAVLERVGVPLEVPCAR